VGINHPTKQKKTNLDPVGFVPGKREKGKGEGLPQLALEKRWRGGAVGEHT